MSRSAIQSSVQSLRRLLAVSGRQDDSDEQLLDAFTMRRDDSAFAVLVHRHGPMVLHACRRVLNHEQDAEDAFQATFLVLAQNAAALRNKTSLAGYLHRIAQRIALKVKYSAAQRRKRETQAPSCLRSDPATEISWREVRALLDEEIARLPEKHRTPFVLCCLEELSQAEAARRLGLNERTLSSRLATARKRLAQCLARRGVELTAVLAASTLATPQASALPIGLLGATVKAAMSTAAGEKIAGIVPASVAELVHGATTALMVSKAKMVAAALLVVSLLTVATSGALMRLSWRPSGSQAAAPELPAAKATARPQPRTIGKEQRSSVEVSGRVVDPDGKPVAGAKLLFIYGSGKEYPHKVWAVSAAEGRFAFAVPVKGVDNGYSEKPWEGTYVVAAAEGYGFAAARVGKPGAADLTLRLVIDDVPIRGRILDLQGRPVAGVRVRIADRLSMPKKGGLADWLAALKANRENPGTIDAKYLMWLYSPAFDLLFPPVTTGADGRFEMKGIGRDRVAHLRIEGPTIATQEVGAMTRASELLRVPVQKEFPKGQHETYLGSTFDLLAAPSRPIVGVVRDKDSGKPLAGVIVESSSNSRSDFIRTTTDKDGRYRLDGMPKGDGNKIVATTRYWVADLPKGDANETAATTNELPYLSAVQAVENKPGLGPVTVDFALKRGVWVKGRVTEKKTGKPLWAGVEYFCFGDNPRANEIARLGTVYNWRSSREDGSFRIPVLPGHGLIAVRAYHDHYVMGVGADKIKGPRAEGSTVLFRTAPHLCFAGNYHALIEIDPKVSKESIACNVTLDPGRTLKGKVLGPDGKPSAGVRVYGLKGRWESDPLPGGNFKVEGLDPNKPLLLSFLHKEKKLSDYLVLRGDEIGPLQVQLKPWGALTGRVVTPLNTPLSSVNVNCWPKIKQNGQDVPSVSVSVYPGKDGRFRIEGLAAGVKYELGVGRSNVQVALAGGNPKDLTVKPGETKDVGDLTVKPME